VIKRTRRKKRTGARAIGCLKHGATISPKLALFIKFDELNYLLSGTGDLIDSANEYFLSSLPRVLPLLANRKPKCGDHAARRTFFCLLHAAATNRLCFACLTTRTTLARLKMFRDVAAQVGYVFSSEAIQPSQPTVGTITSTNPVREGPKNDSRWSFNKTAESPADEEEFLSRCDENGKVSSSLFKMQKSFATRTKITWKHESGFSFQFYFHRVAFAMIHSTHPQKNKNII
jgi:hypothetical protein